MYEGRKGIRQINKAQYDQDYAAAMARWEPAGQQTLESHVVVPSMIAFTIGTFFAGTAAGFVILTCEVLSHFSATPLDPLNMWSIMFVLMAFTTGFLGAFLWRIGVGDKMLIKTEEMTGLDLNGDGEIGIAPRSVRVNTKRGSRDVPLANEESTLYPRDWAEVAIAVLNKRANVSWRGINANCKLSQSQSQTAASHLKKGYVNEDGITVNGRGWDFLIAYLPQDYACMIDQPDSPTDTAPSLSDAGWGGLQDASTNQPTNQPGE